MEAGEQALLTYAHPLVVIGMTVRKQGKVVSRRCCSSISLLLEVLHDEAMDSTQQASSLIHLICLHGQPVRQWQ